MQSWLDWIGDEVRQIPGELVRSVKTDIERAAQSAWQNIRTDAANAVNQVGAAMTSSAAGAIAPGNRQPVTIPLSSGQLVAVAIAIALLVGLATYGVMKR